MIAWDTETRSFRWWENAAFLGSWSTDGQGGGNVAVLPVHTGLATDLEAFARAVKNEKHHVLANAKFDGHMGREALGEEILFKPGNRVDDVLMRSRLLFGNLRNGHGLKELAKDYVDPTALEAEVDMQDHYKALTGKSDMAHDDSYFTTWQHFPEIVERYAGLDAVYTYRLEEILRPMMEQDAKLTRLYEEVERPVMEVLYHAERHGVHVDPEAVDRLKASYLQRDAAARSALEQALGFVPEGTGSEDALREGLLRVGVPLTEVTEKTGELAVNRKALNKFIGHPAVDALFEFRRVNKFLSTYIAPLEGVEHIHPTFNQAQAWTGRMSGSNPNMQNLPKRTEVGVEANMKMRSVFIPSPGYDFWIADFDSIEMRFLAYYLGVQEYRDEIANGDPHARTAAAAWPSINGEPTTPEMFYKSTPNRWLRDAAKQVTYSIVYGGGGPVVMDTLNKMVLDAGHPEFMVDLDQARAIRRKITGAIPGFDAFTKSPYKGKQYPQGRLYQQMLKSRIESNGTAYGYVRTFGGRKQWISFEKAYVALSGEIQGSAADAMKMAAIAVYEAGKPYGARPVLFVHDEIVVEIPKGSGPELDPILTEAMEGAAIIDPPLKVESHVTSKSYAHTD